MHQNCLAQDLEKMKETPTGEEKEREESKGCDLTLSSLIANSALI